jgi:hypothetical protein
MAAQNVQMCALEKEFQESLAGVVLEGQSTRDGRPGVFEDKYTIDKVVKQGEDKWVFYTRFPYSGKEVSLPLPLAVKWAGDTPVITVDNLAIPGGGSYTARVIVYKGHYAGTWSGSNGGGKVFGRIVKQ